MIYCFKGLRYHPIYNTNLAHAPVLSDEEIWGKARCMAITTTCVSVSKMIMNAWCMCLI